jgi:putative transposase
MLLTYKFRIYPRRKQIKRINNNLDICKEVYNNLLNLNINNYKNTKKSLKKYDFNNYLSGKHKEVYSQVLQNVSDRVSKAFQNFYRRIKEKKCKKKGFPRYKSTIKSITYPQSGLKLSKKLYCSKVGNIPIKLHRKLKGKVKTLTIKQNRANQYFACFSVEIKDKKIKHKSN